MLARHALVVAAAVALLGSFQMGAGDRVIVEKNVEARMRDGVILRADVYRPSAPGKHPILLQRTPYSKNDEAFTGRFRALAGRGFVVVVQDTRGRYMSDGVARPHDEAEDGFDTIAWARTLAYANGTVGMWGGSYLATTQLLAATLQPEGLVALFPSSSYSSRYDMVFQGGAFYLSDGLGWNLGQAMDVRRRILAPHVDRDGPIGLDAELRRALRERWVWQLPLKSMDALELKRFAPGYFEMLDHPAYDSFWETSDIAARHHRVEAPAYHLTGWYDTLLTGTLRNFTGLRARAATETARRHQRLIVGPWTHARPTMESTRIGEVSYGPAAGLDAEALQERWFDAWLRNGDRGVLEGAPVRIFVMGENKWRDEQEWPLARAKETAFYLHGGGRANTLDGDGTLGLAPPANEPHDRLTYDPWNPVPTGALGGYSRIPSDQRPVERRQDVLVYTSAPLERDREVTGPLAVSLWIASSAPQTDFTATLVDVHPDGTARALNDGILRARLVPGEPTEITIDLGATSTVFFAGHRIRLDVSSSNFPRFDRNPNTNAPFGEATELRRAEQTVFHDAARPSRLVLPVVPRHSPEPSILGFSQAASAAQRDVESRFMAGVSAEAMSDLHRRVTRRPHVAGSAASMEVAATLQQALAGAGLETEVHEYEVLLSTPESVSAAIVGPVPEPLLVTEPSHAADPDSSHADLGPGYVAYSASGTVAAPIVYVNYGLPPDYAELAAAGVDVKGAIVLARYARSHRAVKIHAAQERGAAGIIIYSDPADDGFARGRPWPEGPWRADFQLQRGNGKYSWFWHGDPLTPGVAATKDAKVLDEKSVPTLPRIPAIVIAAKEAEKILRRLEGPAAPETFRGRLPLTYRLGPGPVAVRLDVRMDQSRRPIRNVIGRLTGRDPDRWVILGTHHDAWTFGGMDPGSGLSAVFEVARGLAALKARGWTPERSMVFAFWDAEEFGLVGSTEYAEGFAQELREKAVAYLNTDLYMTGRFDGGGTPSLRDFLVEVAKDVPSFTGRGSVYDGWRAASASEVELAALGSGADFVAFQDFLGLPTLQMEFDFEGSYGAYHSNYDTRRYVDELSDPGFVVGRTLVQVLGLSVMRLASAQALPFRYSHYARKIGEFLDSAETWPGAARVTPDLSASKRLIVRIGERARALERALDASVARSTLSSARARTINDGLVRLEQALLDGSDPPDTRWYRHVIYGWNIYSLYAGQPLPGLAEAIRLGDERTIGLEVKRIEAALARMLEALERMTVEQR
ncbi:MAG: CocE/NonD family hydrolase [Vicinamibacterales bacterium]